MVGRLVMMVGGGVMISGGLMMVLTGRMFRGLCHVVFLPNQSVNARWLWAHMKALFRQNCDQPFTAARLQRRGGSGRRGAS
jgi:hypothetical protein